MGKRDLQFVTSDHVVARHSTFMGTSTLNIVFIRVCKCPRLFGHWSLVVLKTRVVPKLLGHLLTAIQSYLAGSAQVVRCGSTSGHLKAREEFK